jgi:tetratricopeptide (TPR) repeat protein
MVGLVGMLGLQSAANVRLAALNDDLKSSNRRERERSQLAMDAINLFHGEVSEDLLLKERRFEKLRNKLLHGAADFYGKLEVLLRERSDRDSRLALGFAYEQLADLTRNIGRTKEALEVLEKAVNVRRGLASEPGASDAVKLDLARSLRSYASELEIHDPKAAEAPMLEALSIANGLKPSNGMTEPLFRVRGKIAYGLGWYYHYVSKEELSADWLRQSAEIFEEGLASSGGSALDVQSLRELVNTHNARTGPLNTLLRTPEALEGLKRANEVGRLLLAHDPDQPIDRNQFATTYYDMGVSFHFLGRHAEAFAAFRAGMDVLDPLVQEYPAHLLYIRTLAQCAFGCGRTNQELGRIEQSLEYSRKAAEAWKRLVDADPDDTYYAESLANVLNHIGWMEFSRGRMPEALAEYEVARVILEKKAPSIEKRFKITPDALSNVRTNISEILRREHRLTEARASCDKAITARTAAIEQMPEALGFRSALAESLLRSAQIRRDVGEVAGAAADLRQAIALYESLPLLRTGEKGVLEACCHAMLASVNDRGASPDTDSVAQGETEKAMAILRRIVAQGYRDALLLRIESGLDPLRSRADFQLLLMDLSMPSDVFAQ